MNEQGPKPPPRVLQIVTDRDRRGAQVFALDLHHGLKERGVTVETVALSEGRQGDLLEIESLGPSRRSLATLRALRARAQKYDIVIAHGSSTLFACAVSLAFTGIPFIYRQISDPLFWAATWPRRLRVAVTIRRAAAIVALSESTAGVLVDHYWLSPDSIAVIPNAVPVGNFHVASEEERLLARERMGLPCSRPVLAYVGALAEEKGVNLVIECVGEIDQASALVVGAGPERSRLNQLAKRIAPGRVVFTGPLDETLDAFSAADILLLPSLGGDSMPAVLIEAGLCGLPAISTPVGAITDIVVDGKTGAVVPIGDLAALISATRELLAKPAKRRSMGEAALEHCRSQFTIEVTTSQWLKLVMSVLGLSVPGPGTNTTS